MKYPDFLQDGDFIGITALSAGVGNKKESFDLSVKQLKENQFNIIETSNVRSKKNISSSASQRVKQLEELVLNKEVKAIMCAAGGDFLIEILPKLKLKSIEKNLKWLIGYSDPTSLLYLITTKLDIATIYGVNGGSFAQEQLHVSLKNSLEILKGNIVIQESFDLYEKERIEGLYKYNLTEKVLWKNLNGDFNESGRIIGGCIDVLRTLLGTKYDCTEEFIEKYKQDGIIWYFDVFSLCSEELYCTLFQMKEAGWFKYIKGVVVGRVLFQKEFSISYEQALKRIFKSIPVIYNADIGHVSPKMTIINGAYAKINSKEGKGRIELKLI